MDKNRNVWNLVFLISLILNLFLIKQLYFTALNVQTSSPITNPVEIVQAQIISHVSAISAIRPSGSAEAILNRIEKAVPKLSFEPLNIYQDSSGIFYFPKTFAGSMELDYLKYKVTSDLKTKVLYNRKLFPLKIGILAMMYDSDAKRKIDVNLMVPFRIPIVDQELCAGVGLQSLTLTKGWVIYSESQVVCGVCRMHDYGSIGLTAGVSFNL